MPDLLTRLLRNAPRWMLLVALVYAPWAYGCTTPRTIDILNWLLAITLGLWVVGFLFVRRAPFISRPFAATAAIILILGWWMVANSGSVFDPEFGSFVALRKWIGSAPGSVDFANSAAMMWRVTLLLGIGAFVVDLAQRPQWLLRLWYTIGIAGGSIALFGLIQKATGAEMIFWSYVPPAARTQFFATYLYHANAGAFLNLVFPPIAGLAIRAIQRGRPIPRAIWLSNLLVVVVAMMANTSRMAQLLSILMAIVLLCAWGPTALRAVAKIEKRWVIAGAVVLLIAIFSLAQASRLDKPIMRWAALSEQLPKDARWLAATAALPAVADAQWLGFGPATFRSIFPHYAHTANKNPGGTWRFLHEDYLQTIIEWGWIGAAAWAFLFFGGIVYALRNWKIQARPLNSQQPVAPKPGGGGSTINHPSWLPRQRMLVPLLVLSLASIALHALVDFPLQIASLQLYVATYLGICWGTLKRAAF